MKQSLPKGRIVNGVLHVTRVDGSKVVFSTTQPRRKQMSLTKRIYKQHREELQAVQETPIMQKLRVSIEKRLENIEALVKDATPDTLERLHFLCDLETAQRSVGILLDKLDAKYDDIPF